MICDFRSVVNSWNAKRLQQVRDSRGTVSRSVSATRSPR